MKGTCNVRFLPALYLFVVPGCDASILYEDIQSIQLALGLFRERNDAIEIGKIDDP